MDRAEAEAVSRRGSQSSPTILFGAWPSIGAVDGICQRASDALAGPHRRLRDWAAGQGAVRVDETGWRSSGAGGSPTTCSGLGLGGRNATGFSGLDIEVGERFVICLQCQPLFAHQRGMRTLKHLPPCRMFRLRRANASLNDRLACSSSAWWMRRLNRNPPPSIDCKSACMGNSGPPMSIVVAGASALG